jgi:hypothetical protein
VENRTGFRRRGHAYLAQQARAALGVSFEGQGLAELPLPLVHTALGAAVCAVAVLLRPQILGFERSAIASGALAALTAMILVGYDRAVYPAERRPGLSATALPVAAVASFATVLAAAPPLSVRVIAGAIASIVIGVVPQLVARRATARENWLVRLLRDAAGIAVLAPVLVAGLSPNLPEPARAALVGSVGLLVSFDALIGETLASAAALLGAFCVSVAVAGATLGVQGSSASIGTRAAALLVLWYAFRGFAGSVAVAGMRRWLVVVEYAAFVIVAGGALGWIAARA